MLVISKMLAAARAIARWVHLATATIIVGTAVHALTLGMNALRTPTEPGPNARIGIAVRLRDACPHSNCTTTYTPVTPLLVRQLATNRILIHSTSLELHSSACQTTTIASGCKKKLSFGSVQVGVRYIGSKSRVAGEIIDLAGEPQTGRFVDAFCGTGSVSAEAARRGWPVTINDSLPSAVAMGIGAVVGRGNVPFTTLEGYENAVATLNSIPPDPGFIHAEYSPASAAIAPVERRYFTEENAARIDAMRAQIERWSTAGALTAIEKELLIADLLQAANRVANISGTYGCFLKEWTTTARREVRLTARALPATTTDLAAFVGDVSTVVTTTADTVYFDPPYTKRQYSAYYHLLETIHAGDSPRVEGVTGLRPWKHKASDFSYKSRALNALTQLINRTSARRILLSYSTEGHVQQSQLVDALQSAGRVTLHEIKSIGRYRPNAAASARGDSVTEYVIEVVPHLPPFPCCDQRGKTLAESAA